MEGKSVIVCVLFISLMMMSQFQVEAKSCCPSTNARSIYNACRIAGVSRALCASLSGCKIIKGNQCPPDYPFYLTLGETYDDVANEYCKLGCVSSVCGAMATLQDSELDSSEAVNGLVEQCTNTCAAFCVKGFTTSTTAVEI